MREREREKEKRSLAFGLFSFSGSDGFNDTLKKTEIMGNCKQSTIMFVCVIDSVS